MIVKIHSRGVGRGSGPVEYLLGKDGNRAGATLDRGDPEMVRVDRRQPLRPAVHQRRAVVP